MQPAKCRPFYLLGRNEEKMEPFPPSVLGTGGDICMNKLMNKFKCDKVLCLNLTSYDNKAATDSSAKAHYCIVDLPEGILTIVHNPITIVLSNSIKLSSIKTVILPEPHQLPPAARIASV